MAGIQWLGFMDWMGRPLAFYGGWAGPAREHPAYHAEKAGDPGAAVAMVAGLIFQLALRAAVLAWS